jgi:hypothetical protein
MAESLYAELTKNDEVLRALGPHKPQEVTSSIAVMAEAFELALRHRHGPVPRREDMGQTVDGIERFMKTKASLDEIETVVRYHLGEDIDVAGIDTLVLFNIRTVGFWVLVGASPRWSVDETRLLLQEADRRVRARGVPLPPAARSIGPCQ